MKATRIVKKLEWIEIAELAVDTLIFGFVDLPFGAI